MLFGIFIGDFNSEYRSYRLKRYIDRKFISENISNSETLQLKTCSRETFKTQNQAKF